MASNIPATAPIQTAPVTPPPAAPAPDAATSTPTGSPYDAAPAAAATGDTASTAPDVQSDKPVKSVRAPLAKQKDDAAQNTAEAGTDGSAEPGQFGGGSRHPERLGCRAAAGRAFILGRQQWTDGCQC